MTRKTTGQRHLRDRAQAAQRSLPGDVLRPRWTPLHRLHHLHVEAEARAWLALRQADIIRKAWQPPEATARPGRLTFGQYAEQWLTHRQLKDRTREHYRWLLDEHLIPAFGTKPLASITSDEVRVLVHRVRRRHAHGPVALLRAAAQHHGHRCQRREDQPRTRA